MKTDSPLIQNLLAKNSFYTGDFQPPPTIPEFAEILKANPSLQRSCIICCCDPRVIPEHIFGLSMGEAIVMRTPGGSVDSALPCLLAIDSVAPITGLIIMRHTDCGTAYWTDDSVLKVLEDRSGVAPVDMMGMRGDRVTDMTFCAVKETRGMSSFCGKISVG
jgi:carbonic anhydrase